MKSSAPAICMELQADVGTSATSAARHAASPKSPRVDVYDPPPGHIAALFSKPASAVVLPWVAVLAATTSSFTGRRLPVAGVPLWTRRHHGTPLSIWRRAGTSRRSAGNPSAAARNQKADLSAVARRAGDDHLLVDRRLRPPVEQAGTPPPALTSSTSASAISTPPN